jgi:predicted Zn finger-like uncharacterized protein
VNTSCPTCGAVYNVAAKDIGRKLKCKKCSTALKVTDEGLEVDAGTGSSAPVSDPKPAPAPAAVADEEADEDEAPRKKKGKDRDEKPAYRGPRTNPIEAIGGIPTVLFGFGVFLVIVFTSFPIIGASGSKRATAYVDKLKLEQASKIKNLIPKNKKPGDLTSDDMKKIEDESKKINDDYEKQIIEAQLDAERTKISNIRDEWMEMYGLMFGFLFVAFGCIGYLRTEQPLTLRIVAAVVLGAMMLIMFSKFGGGCASPIH